MYIEVHVKADSNTNSVAVSKNKDGSEFLLVELKAKAKNGEANMALTRVLAKHFRVPRESIRVKRGLTSRFKLVEIVSFGPKKV